MFTNSEIEPRPGAYRGALSRLHFFDREPKAAASAVALDPVLACGMMMAGQNLMGFSPRHIEWKIGSGDKSVYDLRTVGVAACARSQRPRPLRRVDCRRDHTAAKVRGFSIELTDKGDGELYQAAAREVKVQWLKEGEQTQMYTAGENTSLPSRSRSTTRRASRSAHVDGVDSYITRVPCKDGRLMYIKKSVACIRLQSRATQPR